MYAVELRGCSLFSGLQSGTIETDRCLTLGCLSRRMFRLVQPCLSYRAVAAVQPHVTGEMITYMCNSAVTDS